MNFEAHNEIENAHLVIDHFGYWPTFHDSEIISITFEREPDMRTSSALLRVYSFEMSDKVVNSFYKLMKHCVVDVEISELVKTEIDGFNHQNALLALEFGREGGNLYCNMVSAYGVEGYVEGKRIKIKSLEPIPEDNALAKD